MRIITAGGSMLAVGAIVGVVVALAVPGGAQTGSAPGASANAATKSSSSKSSSAASAHFNPLVPYASFGWLPAGYRPTGGNTPMARMTTQVENLDAGSGSPGTTTFSLSVAATGACTNFGSATLPVLGCPNGYGPDVVPIQATSSAPDVNGRLAFWAKGAASSTLLWQYAPRAWSTLEVSTKLSHWPLTHARAQLLIRIAANVKYGNTTPLAFPFWTTDVPAGWTADLVSFLVAPSGETFGQAVGLGPGPAPSPEDGALGMTIVAATSGNSCASYLPAGGHVSDVTLDGTKAVLRTDSQGSILCADDVGGLRVDIAFYTINQETGKRVPRPSGFNGVLGFARSLHLLGPHPSNWTRNPVRAVAGE